MTEQMLETVFHIQSKIRFEPLYQAGQAVFKTGKAASW
jgi:iron complex transport system ATP-binding protein